MTRVILKVLVTSLIIVCASELGKRWTWAGALLISLPLTSILALTWLYADTRDTEKVAEMSRGIFYLVFPSLLFFLLLPWFLRMGLRFELAMGLSCAGMAAGYWVYSMALRAVGI